ncbi:MAG: hypothetical protein ACI94Y_003989 [Maribacter sp.]|jgi:hypothetical protein
MFIKRTGLGLKLLKNNFFCKNRRYIHIYISFGHDYYDKCLTLIAYNAYKTQSQYKIWHILMNSINDYCSIMWAITH